MLYCSNCMLLVDENVCYNCGKKKLCEPKPNDPVYLITKDFFVSAIVEDVLNQNHIPFLKQGTLGSVISIGFGCAVENYQFYVPFGFYEKSKELVSEIIDDTESEE